MCKACLMCVCRVARPRVILITHSTDDARSSTCFFEDRLTSQWQVYNITDSLLLSDGRFGIISVVCRNENVDNDLYIAERTSRSISSIFTLYTFRIARISRHNLRAGTYPQRKKERKKKRESLEIITETIFSSR